jgi:hypothetical protein
MSPQPLEPKEEPCRLDASAVGRTLSRAVRDEHGRTLLPAGTTLTSAHVEKLGRLDLTAVWVTEDRSRGGEALSKLDKVFKDRLDNPLMLALHTAARKLLERTGSE